MLLLKYFPLCKWHFFPLLLLLYDMYVSCHRHFFLVLLLNQRWSPSLRLQASHCSTFRIMCDVPSIAVSCSESIECFPGTASKFFLKLLVTIPVASIINLQSYLLLLLLSLLLIESKIGWDVGYKALMEIRIVQKILVANPKERDYLINLSVWEIDV